MRIPPIDNPQPHLAARSGRRTRPLTVVGFHRLARRCRVDVAEVPPSPPLPA